MAEYIEREALEHHFMTKRRFLDKDTVMDAAYEVNKFPAADVAPAKKSFWEVYDTEAYVGAHSNGEPKWAKRRFFRCERCRKGTAVKTNYCSNCGAKMDGGADG